MKFYFCITFFDLFDNFSEIMDYQIILFVSYAYIKNKQNIIKPIFFNLKYKC